MSTTTTQVLLPGQHAAPEGPVDLTNMYLMHHAFRRDLTAFRAAVEQASITDHARWVALHQRWQLFAMALHHHHAAEDEGLWPLLLDRIAASGDDGARAVLEAMQAEHAQIDPLLDSCARQFDRLATRATETERADLQRSLDEAWHLLDGHLGHEEREAMVILQRQLTDADWRSVEKKHFVPAYSPRQVLSIVPWVMADLPTPVRRRALAAGGPPASLIWRLGRRAYARRTAAAFGSHPAALTTR